MLWPAFTEGNNPYKYFSTSFLFHDCICSTPGGVLFLKTKGTFSLEMKGRKL